MCRFLCRLGIHHFDDTLKRFNFCRRCGTVWWFPGTGYWDLDVCDTRYIWDYVEVYKP